MKDALSHIISSIVTIPEALQIDETEEDGLIRFSVHLAKEDMGRVIGKEGKVIRAVRNVMKIPAIKQGKKIDIALVEN